LKTDVNISSNVKGKKLRKTLFFVDILRAIEEKNRIRIRNPVYRSKNPDPYQNVKYQQHWLLELVNLKVIVMKGRKTNLF
jgi:hypothetical protein